MKPIDQLVQIISTNLYNEEKYYGKVNDVMNEALCEVAKTDPEFILKLASFCRNEFYLRTISIYTLVACANLKEFKGTGLVAKYAPQIIQRADELSEVMSCQLEVFGKPIPNSLKKGIAASFKNFDEYQLAKYNRESKVSLRDIIMLTHVKDPSILIKKVLDEKLKVPYTWETQLSAKGNSKEVWEELLSSNKVGYMALIRNLNNIGKVKVSDTHWKSLMATIADEKRVRGSKQLPFRFYSALAYNEETDPFRKKELATALGTALGHSVANLPKLAGRTVCAADVSGSMDSALSKNSKVSFKQISCLMTAMTNKFSENALAVVFGEKLGVLPDLSGNILSDTQKLMNAQVGHSTNGYLVFQYLNTQKIQCDRVIIFTDCELYHSGSTWAGYGSSGSINTEFEHYLKNVNPQCKLYLVNLNSYGDVPINTKNKNVVLVSGWSERILEFIATHEESQETFVARINKFKPREKMVVIDE